MNNKKSHIGNIKKNVERSIKRLGISTSHFESVQRVQLSKERYTKEKLEILVKECKTYKEILEKLDILNITNNYTTLKRRLDDYKMYSGDLKSRLYKEGLKERKCQMCGQDENWNGKHMSLIIDRIHNDNRLENLRILCPNCNATLDTHCGKNSNIKIRRKKEDLKLEKKKEFILSKRTVERPSYDNLKIDIETIGYLGTGKKYGVSDNSIRKWMKTYKKYGI